MKCCSFPSAPTCTPLTLMISVIFDQSGDWTGDLALWLGAAAQSAVAAASSRKDRLIIVPA
jgi:hypothetical protein